MKCDKKSKELNIIEEIASKSKLTEKDAEILGHKIKESIRKRLAKEYKCS